MPLSKRVDLATDEYTFLVRSLHMTLPTLAQDETIPASAPKAE
jgi:hypothetical protein